MDIQVYSEAEVMREAAQLLVQHLSPAKAARFWAGWQQGQGDYLVWREEVFANETVATLYEKVSAYEAESTKTTKS